MLFRIRGRVGVSSFDGGSRARVDVPVLPLPTRSGAADFVDAPRGTWPSSSNGEADMADALLEGPGPSASVGVCIQVAMTSSSSAPQAS